MLTKIRIEKLFDIFDYEIELKSGGITILTGPNGYGKTTVLKIMDALASQNSFFFVALLFQKITFCLIDGNTIVLKKIDKDEVEVIVNKDKPFRWNEKSLNKIIKEQLPQFRQIAENKWFNRRVEEIVSRDTLLQRLTAEFPETAERFQVRSLPKSLKTPKVYFIREQRLLRPVAASFIFGQK